MKRGVSMALGGVALAGGLAVLLALPLLRWASWRREGNLERRGFEAAERLGCFSCHGEGGQQGIANPGHPSEVVPSWDSETARDLVHDERDIREYILKGFPDRKRAVADLWEEYQSGAIRMPAFARFLGRGDLEALVAYFKVVSDWDPLPPQAGRGRLLARQQGCFSCHGDGGLGGARNPGSFKGYIPGWRGGDYAELVRDDAELRDWILSGSIPRYDRNRLAQHFLSRQAIAMPGFEGVLSETQLSDLMAYIETLRLDFRAKARAE